MRFSFATLAGAKCSERRPRGCASNPDFFPQEWLAIWNPAPMLEKADSEIAENLI
jgi:hypothetical protein